MSRTYRKIFVKPHHANVIPYSRKEKHPAYGNFPNEDLNENNHRC